MSHGRWPQLIQPPDSAPNLRGIAEDILRQAGAVGILPTPIDELLDAARVEKNHDPEPLIQAFLGRLRDHARDTFLAGIQKIRGIADLRERAIYIAAETSDRRRLFVKSHELGHQVIPWHQINFGYCDDERSLRSDAEDVFDQEANFFAAEVIFQGHHFTSRARDYAASLDAVFMLADEHGATRHATLWRYVQDQDECLAAIPYWPSSYDVDSHGHPILRRGRVVGSPRFVEKFARLEIPPQLITGHPWVATRDLGHVCGDCIQLTGGSGPERFEWQAWWNTYCLFVLLRRTPVLGVVGRFLHSAAG